MGIWGYIFLVIAHYFTGRGLLYLFKIEMKPLATFMLSMIVGVILVSFYPIILQFAYIPITKTNVFICILLFTVLLNSTSLKKYKLSNLNPLKIKFDIRIYEIPYLVIFSVFMFISAWRCFYFLPFARDILSGPEAIADFTIKEHTYLNSIFTLDLESTNNHLKSPFVADLQIIYKLFVYSFGEVWLSLIAIPFLIWAYTLLKEKLHPLVATSIMLFFITMPDPFAYTYIVLFDYCNMICFFAGYYFLAQYIDNKKRNYLHFSAFMFGLATYIRPETLILVGMTLPLVFFYLRKEKLVLSKILIRSALFLFIPFLFYFFWTGIFSKYYMPVHFDVSTQINKNLSNLDPFFNRLTEMTKILIFGISDNPGQKDINLRLFGYFIYLFLFLFAIDLVFFRKKINTESRVMLYGILVVYIGLPLLGFLIPWVDLMNTTKRGLYKLFPLMLLYMRNSGILTLASDAIKSWEMPKIIAKSIPKPQPAAQQVNIKNKKKGK